jgi:hypothetical protein
MQRWRKAFIVISTVAWLQNVKGKRGASMEYEYQELRRENESVAGKVVEWAR